MRSSARSVSLPTHGTLGFPRTDCGGGAGSFPFFLAFFFPFLPAAAVKWRERMLMRRVDEDPSLSSLPTCFATEAILLKPSQFYGEQVQNRLCPCKFCWPPSSSPASAYDVAGAWCRADRQLRLARLATARMGVGEFSTYSTTLCYCTATLPANTTRQARRQAWQKMNCLQHRSG